MDLQQNFETFVSLLCMGQATCINKTHYPDLVKWTYSNRICIGVVDLSHAGINAAENPETAKPDMLAADGTQKQTTSKTNPVPRAVTKAKQMYMGETTPARRKARLKEVINWHNY